MNVTCTHCQTVFRVDPAKVPEAGVRARCSVCAGVFWVRHDALEPSAAPLTATPASASPAPWEVPAPPPAAAPMLPTPAPVAAPSPSPAPAPSPAAAPYIPPPFRPSPAPAPPAPVFRSPVTSPPPSPPTVRPAGPPPPTFAAPGARPPPAPVSFAPPAAPAPAPAAAPLPPGAPAPVKPKRPTNPFLSQDPEARARRLARALVSDIVVYHPAKRRDGLRDGSLKLLFEEEIKKSWEEYVDQVGRELAETSTFLTDALNEILADGQPVFP